MNSDSKPSQLWHKRLHEHYISISDLFGSKFPHPSGNHHLHPHCMEGQSSLSANQAPSARVLQLRKPTFFPRPELGGESADRQCGWPGILGCDVGATSIQCASPPPEKNLGETLQKDTTFPLFFKESKLFFLASVLWNRRRESQPCTDVWLFRMLTYCVEICSLLWSPGWREGQIEGWREGVSCLLSITGN